MTQKYVTLIALISAASVYASTVVPINEGKRIEAAICPDSMNRVAVANDRITQIFGDEGTFETQNDEATGQVFLKPTAENGTKALSVTLITEQGVTQDLTLKPTSKTATTVILKNQAGATGVASKPEESFAAEKSLPLQEQMLTLLKHAVMGQLPVKEGVEPLNRAAPDGFQVSYQQTFQAGAYGVHVFEVENVTDTDIEIQEKDFYHTGDLALSVRQRHLAKGSKTRLYVVGRA